MFATVRARPPRSGWDCGKTAPGFGKAAMTGGGGTATICGDACLDRRGRGRDRSPARGGARAGGLRRRTGRHRGGRACGRDTRSRAARSSSPGHRRLHRLPRAPRGLDVPIIFVTAKGEEVDRVVGLELGADDYVVKPFGLRDSSRASGPSPGARKPVGTRTPRSRSGPYESTCAPIARRSPGAELELTPKDFDLLKLLAAEPGVARLAANRFCVTCGTPPGTGRPRRSTSTSPRSGASSATPAGSRPSGVSVCACGRREPPAARELPGADGRRPDRPRGAARHRGCAEPTEGPDGEDRARRVRGGVVVRGRASGRRAQRPATARRRQLPGRDRRPPGHREPARALGRRLAADDAHRTQLRHPSRDRRRASRTDDLRYPDFRDAQHTSALRRGPGRVGRRCARRRPHHLPDGRTRLPRTAVPARTGCSGGSRARCGVGDRARTLPVDRSTTRDGSSRPPNASPTATWGLGRRRTSGHPRSAPSRRR